MNKLPSPLPKFPRTHKHKIAPNLFVIFLWFLLKKIIFKGSIFSLTFSFCLECFCSPLLLVEAWLFLFCSCLRCRKAAVVLLPKGTFRAAMWIERKLGVATPFQMYLQNDTKQFLNTPYPAIWILLCFCNNFQMFLSTLDFLYGAWNRIMRFFFVGMKKRLAKKENQRTFLPAFNNSVKNVHFPSFFSWDLHDATKKSCSTKCWVQIIEEAKFSNFFSNCMVMFHFYHQCHFKIFF